MKTMMTCVCMALVVSLGFHFLNRQSISARESTNPEEFQQLQDQLKNLEDRLEKREENQAFDSPLDKKIITLHQTQALLNGRINLLEKAAK